MAADPKSDFSVRFDGASSVARLEIPIGAMWAHASWSQFDRDLPLPPRPVYEPAAPEPPRRGSSSAQKSSQRVLQAPLTQK